MEQLDLGALRVSERSLRDGLVMDHNLPWRVKRNSPDRLFAQTIRFAIGPLDSRSTLNTPVRFAGWPCRIGADSAKECTRLHSVDEWRKDNFSNTLLHDIGTYLSFHNHHLHGAYLIRNAELLGFDQKETALLSATVLFHQKGLAQSQHAECEGLDKDSIKTVAILSVFLRLAESLNRRRLDVVRSAALT